MLILIDATSTNASTLKQTAKLHDDDRHHGRRPHRPGLSLYRHIAFHLSLHRPELFVQSFHVVIVDLVAFVTLLLREAQRQVFYIRENGKGGMTKGGIIHFKQT